MITRKIGKLIRGKATPFQLGLACVLGGLIGATPGFSQGPGLYLTLMALLLVLNANLGIAALVGMLTKLLSMIAMPFQFEIGRWLLDGPTEPLFKWAVNTPVLAWYGFDYYAVTGSLVFGLVVGLAFAFVIIKILSSIRRQLVKLESKDPEERGRVQKTLDENKVARFLVWVFFGKRAKKSYEDIAKTKIGRPIRPMGVVIVLLGAALIWIGTLFLQEPLVTYAFQQGLERANGATVDLASADVDLGAGTMTASGLAMADPENLGTDLLRAGTLTADLGTRDLLLRRFAFDLIEVSDASSGEARRIPGVLTRPRPETPEPEGDAKTIDDYLKQAEAWKERLRQVREWLEKGQSDDPDAAPGEPGTEEESYRDRLRRRIAELGYTRVRAEHLIDGAPTVLVRELRINGLTLAQVEGEILDVHGAFLASQPALVTEGTPVLDVASRSGNLGANVAFGAGPGQTTTLKAHRLGLPGDTIGSMLSAATGQAPISGGEVDLRIDGSLVGAIIDGSLGATIRGSTLQIAGNATQVDHLELPIGLAGPVDSPRVNFSNEALTQALIDAGKAEAANRLKDEAGKVLGDVLGDSEEGAQIQDAVGDALGGLLGGKKEEPEDDGGG